jgi:hypothetical protein
VRPGPAVEGVPAGQERFAALLAAATWLIGHREAYFRDAFAAACSWNVRERSTAASFAVGGAGGIQYRKPNRPNRIVVESTIRGRC